MRQITCALAALAYASISAAPAAADTFTLAGDTTASPTFHRAYVDAGGVPQGLSPFYTSVRYDSFSFTVDAAGSYDFLLTTGWDPYLFLYEGSFDPAAGMANLVIGNDQGPSVNASAFTHALSAGSTYVAVIAGYDSYMAGTYALEIAGPGHVTGVSAPAPEPAAWALMILGFGAVGGAIRRRPRAPA